MDKTDSTPNAGEAGADAEEPKRTKTILEQDEELRLKLEGISGEGGGAGVEYEGGKAVGLKRGVRENEEWKPITIGGYSVTSDWESRCLWPSA